jgi:ABC-type multidrug transport system ATPase subunit
MNRKADCRILARHEEKLSLACALIHSPEILFLDEPFEGVDALASRTLKLLSRLTARGLTVFLTSHVLEIVERLCTDIAIIAEGPRRTRVARRIASRNQRRSGR